MPESTGPGATAAPAAKSSNFSSEGITQGGDLSTSVDFFSRSKAQAIAEDGGNVPQRDNNPIRGYEELEIDFSNGQQGEVEGDEGTEDTEEESVEGEVEDQGDDAEEPEGGKDEEVEDEKPEPELAQKKTSKLKVGEKEFDVPDDATVPVKVDGKMVDASIQDLKNAFSSKASIASSIAEAKKAKEEVVAERRKVTREFEQRNIEHQTTKAEIGQLTQAVQKGDYAELITQALTLAGANPADAWDQMDQIFGEYYSGNDKQKGFTQLSEAERRALQLNRRNAFQQGELKRITEANQRKESVTKLETFKQQVHQYSGVTADEVQDAWDGFERLAQAGKLTSEQIASLTRLSAEDRYKIAAAEALGQKTRARVAGVVEKNHPSLKAKIPEMLSEMEKTMGTEFLIKATDQNIADLISRVYRKDTKSNAGSRNGNGKAAITTSKLSDKATPRHTVTQAAAQGIDELDDPYAQDRGRPSSQVWGGSFKTFA